MRRRSVQRQNNVRAFQSTHPLRGATFHFFATEYHPSISIHAPLAGCDRKTPARSLRWQNFNPRTPCGVRPPTVKDEIAALVFQSTHPLRGATAVGYKSVIRQRDFNPRTPCGVRLAVVYDKLLLLHFNPRTPCGVRHACLKIGEVFPQISIHAPLAGCDLTPVSATLLLCHFNPRTPCGVRLGGQKGNPELMNISIHAPLAGCDYSVTRTGCG